MPSGKCKFTQRDTTEFLLKWPKPSTLTSNADDDAEQQKFSYMGDGNR